MAPKDRQPRYEQRTQGELEQHMHGLRAVENRVREIRLHSRLGKSGIPGAEPSPVFDDEHGRYAFATAATKLGSQLDARKNPDEKMYADILARLPSTVDSITLADDKETPTGSYQAKLRLAEFNEVLRSSIDSHPHIQPETIIALIKSATLRYGYGPDEINETARKAGQSLRAMKHELSYASALYRLPYDIEDTGIKDDKNGVDFRVRMPNGVVVTIDVKASEGTAQRRRDEQAEYYQKNGKRLPRNKLIVYSGFIADDFTKENPWRPTEDAIARVLPLIDTQLREAAGMEGIDSLERIG